MTSVLALLVGWIGPGKFAGQLAIAGAAATVIRPHWLPLAAALPVAAFVLVASMNSSTPARPDPSSTLKPDHAGAS